MGKSITEGELGRWVCLKPHWTSTKLVTHQVEESTVPAGKKKSTTPVPSHSIGSELLKAQVYWAQGLWRIS